MGINDFNMAVKLRKDMPDPFPEKWMIISKQYSHGLIGMVTRLLQGEVRLIRAPAGTDL
jgi:hypothetical protein